MIPTPPIPFLKSVAEKYVQNELNELRNYCFVMPNKRSGVFLAKYFGDVLGANRPTLLPAITTISEFIESQTNTVEASKIEQLFILYNVYSRILSKSMTEDEKKNGNDLIDFNRFQYWGEMLLNDFNDVDKYLVNPEEIFKNIEKLKEISSNFLTADQIEIIKKHWKIDDNFLKASDDDKTEFWKHVVYQKNGNGGKNATVAGFVKIWQAMLEIYKGFRDELTKVGHSYSDMSYREVAEKLEKINPKDLPYRRYIFVGFNALSKSERSIFESLQKLNIADFYWDFASPTFEIKSNTASRFLKDLVKNFKSRYPIDDAKINYFPNVEILTLPSTIGQTREVKSILHKLYPNAFSNKSAQAQKDFVKTAIVLPDESIALPLLRTLSSDVETINVTMGYSLRQTPVCALLAEIISLQLRARKLKYNYTFYYEDVLNVLSNPLVRVANARACNRIAQDIRAQRLFNIPKDYFKNLLNESHSNDNLLSKIFEWVDYTNNPMEVFDYLNELLDSITDNLNKVNSESGGDDDISQIHSLEVGFIHGYKDAIKEIKRLAEKYLKGIYLEDRTVFHLVERMAGQMTVQFEGMPLKGLQVMGVLESRCLDFDNVFILSMNERIFPRKHYSRSFIPNSLRHGFGMATLEYQESIYAYYFYRLITRAKNVFLLYDGRTTGVRSGAASRYINQLRYIFPADRLKFKSGNYSIHPIEEKPLEVKKEGWVMNRLDDFKKDLSKDGARCFSASSLNTYINCPLQFYLQYIDGYTQEDDLKDFLDDATYGSILHDALEKIYTYEKGSNPELKVTPQLLEKFAKKNSHEIYLKRAILHFYLGKPYCNDGKGPEVENESTDLPGDAEVYLKIMSRTLTEIFKKEKLLLPFSFIKAEEGGKIKLSIKNTAAKAQEINLNYRIDRVDIVHDKNDSDANGNETKEEEKNEDYTANDQSYIRLIDYKTGGDTLSFPSVESLFDSSNENRNKAVFQLLLYSLAYDQHDNVNGLPIQPRIYSIRRVSTDGFKLLSCNREPVEFLEDSMVNLFKDKLFQLLNEIFDKDHPFTANPSEKHCKYCAFSKVCNS